MTGNDHCQDVSTAAVELHIRPPLSYGVSKKAGGLVLRESFIKGETLGELLARLEAQTPAAFEQVYDPGRGQIRRPVVTVVNGTILPRSQALRRALADGDRIAWFLIYAGG